MRIFLKHCRKRHNLIRAIIVGFVVGTILALINHYDMILYSTYSTRRFIQVILTYFVPFLVSLHGAAMYGRHKEMCPECDN
ncbi:hypothetical protein CMI39_01755 [Candidatus Pacearchaeota archaeon]|jgi:ascorbate-specific PTS system EIIC-type component UlaA|nr:hypothetical protein [Candidatus Pacearchaeota archaeon]|tara:strand:- start:552 stop:794 length:243 start_codon:yes stop_codon:yes gene_type:complete